MIFFHYQVNNLFLHQSCKKRTQSQINFFKKCKNAKNHFLLLKKVKNTESAQLWRSADFSGLTVCQLKSVRAGINWLVAVTAFVISRLVQTELFQAKPVQVIYCTDLHWHTGSSIELKSANQVFIFINFSLLTKLKNTESAQLWMHSTTATTLPMQSCGASATKHFLSLACDEKTVGKKWSDLWAVFPQRCFSQGLKMNCLKNCSAVRMEWMQTT